MVKPESKSNNSIVQALHRLQGISIIKKESISTQNSRSNSFRNDELNISINTEPHEIHRKLSNPFVNKTIKFRVPPSVVESAANNATAAAAAKYLKLQVRKCSIPNDGYATDTKIGLQHIASPMLYPNCSKCGAKLDNIPEFQKRIAGYESNFLIDFVCVRCVKQRQAVTSDKRKFEELAVEIVKKFAGQPNELEETLYIENVDVADVKKECFEDPDSDNESTVSGLRDAGAVADDDIASIGAAEYLEPDFDCCLSQFDRMSDDNMPVPLSSTLHETVANELTLLSYDDNAYTEDENDDDDDAEPMQYHCVECNRSYTTLIRLKNHGYYVHNPRRQRKLRARPVLPYKCDVCHNTYHTLAKLKAHIYYMHVDCPSSVAKRTRRLNKPLHKPFKMIDQRNGRQSQRLAGGALCKICMADFVDGASLARHELKLHANLMNYPADSIFECHVCSFAYKHYKALQSHIYYAHSTDLARLRLMRARRSRRNNSYNIVRQGRKVMLLLIKPLFGDEKTAVAVNIDDTLIVQSKNEATEKYNCPLCARSYKASIMLKTHLSFFDHDAVLQGRPTFNCEHCKTAYPSTQSLRNHFYYKHKDMKPSAVAEQTNRCRTATDEGDVLLDICDDSGGDEIRCRFCKKKYATFRNLQNHVYYKHPKQRAKWRPKIEYLDDSDSDEEDFQFYCQHCDKRYPSFKYLRCHFYYMHPDEKPTKPADLLPVVLDPNDNYGK